MLVQEGEQVAPLGRRMGALQVFVRPEREATLPLKARGGTSVAAQGLISRAAMQEAWVRSLVGELGSFMPRSSAKKLKIKTDSESLGWL